MPTNAKAFKDLLVEAITNLKQLLSLLNQEKQLLETAQAQPDDIAAINKSKSSVLEAIEQDINNRKTFLQGLDLSPDETGVNNFFTSLPTNLSTPLSKGWAQLTAILDQVQEANSINGQLINRASQHYDTLINAVKTTQAKVKVYNPKGGAGSLNTGRNLGSA